MTAEIYLSLGSNVGDRVKNLRNAATRLNDADVRILQTSSLYETEPVDYLDQPWFLNIVVKAETQLEPLSLLRTLRSMESEMGSHKLIPKGPRLIDMDLLLYGEETIDLPELQVPHPRMAQRRFVLEPLVEIAPHLRHSSWLGTAQQLLAATPDQSTVRKFSP